MWDRRRCAGETAIGIWAVVSIGESGDCAFMEMSCSDGLGNPKDEVLIWGRLELELEIDGSACRLLF